MSKTSSTLARLAGLRLPEPLKITSCIDSPRSSLAFDSPSTQRTASMMFDLPQPFGPDHADQLAGQLEVGGFGERLEAGQLDGIQTHGVAVRPRQVPLQALKGFAKLLI